MVRAILFDAVGTLIHPDPSVAAVYSAAGRRFGVDIDAEELRIRFRDAFARQEAIDRRQHEFKTSLGRERDRWREIVGEVFAGSIFSLERREELFHALWEHFAQPENWRIDENIMPCWQALEAQGLTIAIASNFDERLEHIVNCLPPLNRAARVYISARIGFRKPSADFFRAIERDLRLRPADLFSVGDDLDNDYLGAEAAGWHAILIDRCGAYQSSNVCRIASLAELSDRFDG
jgi:putative hydrolase of the HAD superfamily